MEDFDKLQSYLVENRNVDLHQLEQSADGIVKEVVARRMKAVGASSCSEYVDRLEVNPQEYDQLFDQVLPPKQVIHADKELMRLLDEHFLPLLATDKEMLRFWCIGCGTGEEAYSLAAAIAERIGIQSFQYRVKIFATDSHEDLLATARQGNYSAEQLKLLPADLISKCFTHNGAHLTFLPDLRRSLIFGKHDLISDAPISRLDMVLCRGILPYLNFEKQKKAASRMKFALSASGLLFLGDGERLSEDRELSPITPRLYAKQSVREAFDLSEQYSLMQANDALGQISMLEDMALDATPIAQIVVDREGTLVTANRKARSTFSLSPQDFGRPLHDLEISYRPLELRSLIEQAVAERQVIPVSLVERHLGNGRVQYFEVICSPIFNNQNDHIGTTIQFEDVSEIQSLQEEFLSVSHQLQTANEELQSTHEELETMNEELQSSNEELETTNEELQSTNEELETMNEELYSINQELEIGNIEQEGITGQVSANNRFIEGVLASMRCGLVVLDEQFRIVLWNARAADMWGLRADEVKGQRIVDLDIGLPVSELEEPLESFLKESKSFFQKDVVAVNRRGRKVNCNLRITRTFTSKERGLIIAVEEYPNGG